MRVLLLVSYWSQWYNFNDLRNVLITFCLDLKLNRKDLRSCESCSCQDTARAGSPVTWDRAHKKTGAHSCLTRLCHKNRLCAFLGNAPHETLTPLFNHIQLVTLELRTRRSNPFCCSGEKSHLRVKRKASLRIGHIATIPCLLIVQRQSEREKIVDLCKDC